MLASLVFTSLLSCADGAPPSAPPSAPIAPNESGRVKVIVLDLKGGALNSAEQAGLTSLVTVALSEYASLEVVSGADVREMLALEGQKQDLGCEESMSCLAEIAGALGARVVAYGSVEKLGSLYLLTLNLQDTKVGRSAGRVALQGDSVEALAKGIPDSIKQMITPFLDAEKLATTSASARATAPAFGAAVKPPEDPRGDAPSSKFFRVVAGGDGSFWTYELTGGVGQTNVSASLIGGGLRLELWPFTWLGIEADADAHNAPFTLNGGEAGDVAPAQFNALHVYSSLRLRARAVAPLGPVKVGAGVAVGSSYWDAGTVPQTFQGPAGPEPLTVVPGSSLMGVFVGGDASVEVGPFDLVIAGDLLPLNYYQEKPDNPGDGVGVFAYAVAVRARVFLFAPLFAEIGLSQKSINAEWNGQGDRRAFSGSEIVVMNGGDVVQSVSGASLRIGLAF